MYFVSRYLHRLIFLVFVVRMVFTFVIGDGYGSWDLIGEVYWSEELAHLAWKSRFDLNIWGLLFFMLCYWGARMFRYKLNPYLSTLHLTLILYPLIFPDHAIKYMELSSWVAFFLNYVFSIIQGKFYPPQAEEFETDLLDKEI